MGEKPSISVYDLVLEVTRRCNMACAHCLRGDAQDLDMDESIIDAVLDQVSDIDKVTFTGGEPSLNVPLIRYFFRQAKKRGVPVGSFYVATNGKNAANQRSLAHALLDAYAQVESPEYCGVTISVDQYHDAKAQRGIVKGLACYAPDKEHDPKHPDEDWVIPRGRAADNGIGRNYPWRPDGYEVEFNANAGTLRVDTIYVSANGRLYYHCDEDYATIDDNEDNGAVWDMTDFFLAKAGIVSFRLYQMDDRDPALHCLIFRNLDNLKRSGFQDPPADKYRLAYSGVLKDQKDEPVEYILENVFAMCNMDRRPEGYHGRSLSVSDVVQIGTGPDTRFFYCQPAGFTAVKFDPSLAMPMDETI